MAKKKGSPPTPASWVKGKSGNPAGFVAPAEVRDLARTFTTTAFESLARMAESDAGAASVAASETLLKWAWHSPARAVADLGDRSGDELVALLEARMAAFAAAGDHQAVAGCVAALERLRPTPKTEPPAEGTTNGVRFVVDLGTTSST